MLRLDQKGRQRLKGQGAKSSESGGKIKAAVEKNSEKLAALNLPIIKLAKGVRYGPLKDRWYERSTPSPPWQREFSLKTGKHAFLVAVHGERGEARIVAQRFKSGADKGLIHRVEIRKEGRVQQSMFVRAARPQPYAPDRDLIKAHLSWFEALPPEVKELLRVGFPQLGTSERPLESNNSDRDPTRWSDRMET